MQAFLACSVLVACLLQGSVACTSGCNAACYNMGEHCCSESGGTCYCKPTGVSCDSAPVNTSDALELTSDGASAPACTSGCNSACYNMGEHCCGQDGDQCTCRPIGVSCAAEPANESSVQVVLDEEVSFPTCTSGCNAACYNMGEHCCSESGGTCYCKPTGVSCGAAPVNVSDALELVKEELSAPACTSGCNAACYNMGEHCCGQDGDQCTCRPIGVSCAAEPDHQFKKLVVKEVSAPACTSGCNSACYNMGEHCCGQDGDQCTCRPIGVSCAAEPDHQFKKLVVKEVSAPACTSGCNSACYNMGEHCCGQDGDQCTCRPIGVSCAAEPDHQFKQLVVKEVSAPACTSGCNSACYNMGEHCCGQDGDQCTCRPIGVSCASEPDNQFAHLVVKDEVSAPACTSGCNSACYNMGEHCCGQDGSTCYCQPTGVSCASAPVNKSTALASVQEELSLPTCTSGCNAACYNMGEHCCSESGGTCYCKPTGVSCSSGQSNVSRIIDLVKEGSADAFMTV